MFKFLKQLLGGPDAERLLANLPADPLRDALSPIAVSCPLHDDERAFLELPAAWYRYRATRRYGGASVRIASGLYLRGGASQSHGPQPTLISEGSAIFTNYRTKFVGTAKSISIEWKDVSEVEQGPDHLKIFREKGDTEILVIDETLLAWGGLRLGNLAARLWNNWRNHKALDLPLHELERSFEEAKAPSESSSDNCSSLTSDIDEVSQVVNENEKLIESSSTPEELERRITFALQYLEDNAESMPAEYLDAARKIATLLASKCVVQMVAGHTCDNQTAEHLWHLIGNTDTPPQRKAEEIGRVIDQNQKQIERSSTPEELEGAFRSAFEYLETNAETMSETLLDLSQEYMKLTASACLTRLIEERLCNNQTAERLWQLIGNTDSKHNPD